MVIEIEAKPVNDRPEPERKTLTSKLLERSKAFFKLPRDDGRTISVVARHVEFQHEFSPMIPYKFARSPRAQKIYIFTICLILLLNLSSRLLNQPPGTPYHTTVVVFTVVCVQWISMSFSDLNLTKLLWCQFETWYLFANALILPFVIIVDFEHQKHNTARFIMVAVLYMQVFSMDTFPSKMRTFQILFLGGFFAFSLHDYITNYNPNYESTEVCFWSCTTAFTMYMTARFTLNIFLLRNLVVVILDAERRIIIKCSLKVVASAPTEDMKMEELT